MEIKGENSKKLIVILGQTASGKSKLAIKLAKKLRGEIISADSRQVYKDMIIGTASPLLDQKSLSISEFFRFRNKKLRIKNDETQKPLIINKIPHYLLHIVSPNRKFNVALYKKLAVRTIKDIQKRGKLPFLAGGTALYIYSVINNLDFPRVPPNEKLRKELEKKSIEKLFKIYKKLDQEGAKHIDKNNKRRLIRAIEVCKITGKSFWKQREKKKPLFDILELGVKTEKKTLKGNVSKRVEKMIKSGLEQEMRSLVKKYGWNIPPLQTIGYSEWKDFFAGKISLNEVKNLINLHTLKFSKRQMTWFKKDKRINWVKSCKTAEKLVENFCA